MENNSPPAQPSLLGTDEADFPKPARTSGGGLSASPEWGSPTSSSDSFLKETTKLDQDDPEPEWDWFGELQREVKEKGISPILFLPVLGCEGYIRVNRAHLLAAYPKGGKTELMVNTLLEWESETILYISEEGRETWQDRAYELPEWPNEMKVVYGLGKTLLEIFDEMDRWTGSVVVIDTIKLLGIEDENDSSKVQAALAPFIQLARRKRQTLIFIHHDNKGGGKGGRGIAGSHAFVGIVDIFLEIDEVKGSPNQRILSGRGKIRNIKGLLYEKGEDGVMRAMGTAFHETETKVFNAVNLLWQTSQEIQEETELSEPTVRRHLGSLFERDLIERDPPEGSVKGKTIRWRRK